MDARGSEAVEENDDGNKSDKDSKMSTNKSSGNDDTEDEAQGEDGSEIRSRSLGKPSFTELQRMHARAAQKTAEIEGKDADDNDGQNSDEQQGDKRLKHRKGELEQWNFYQVQEVEQFTAQHFMDFIGRGQLPRNFCDYTAFFLLKDTFYNTKDDIIISW